MYFDEISLMALVAAGESEAVDFKSTLPLESKDEKAEFIKDVISLANSAPGKDRFTGYLLIGVNDERLIVGTDRLDEERIQQIVQTYTHPPLSIRCSTLPTQTPGWLQVGIIEVKGLERPYSVARAIGKLQQGDVFVRHGSVVSKATKEDIVRMDSETHGTAEARRYIQAAETHMALGNYEEAVETYSSAIRLLPTADLFLARGKARCMSITNKAMEYSERQHDAHLALRDFSAALVLAHTPAIQKQARFERLRSYKLLHYKDWAEDCDWLKENTTGQEYGEVICRYYWAMDNVANITAGQPTEVITAMDEVIECGYSHADVFELRATSNFYLHNYGLALQDIDTALEMTNDRDMQIEYHSWRANILSRMRRFEEAYESFKAARRLHALQSKESFTDPIGYVESELEDEILWRYALTAEFGQLRSSSSASAIVSILLHNMGARDRIRLAGYSPENETKTVRGIEVILQKYRLALNSLKDVVGEEFWNSWRHGSS